MLCSAARSAAVTGSKPADFLVLDREGGSKKGKDGFARCARELVDETAEVDGRHAPCLAACLV
jgi:hypothetical protein